MYIIISKSNILHFRSKVDYIYTCIVHIYLIAKLSWLIRISKLIHMQWMTESMFFTLGRNWKLLICTQITYLCTLLVSFYLLTFLLSLFHFIPLFHLDTLKIRQLNLDMMRHTCKNLIPMVVKRAMANSSKNNALLMCRIWKMGWNLFSSLDIRENPLFVLFPA